MTEFRLLGPFVSTVALPGGKPRALLARLLLDRGRVVSTEALVESLWGEDPPPSAPKVLQAHVSALRKALGAQTIETRAPGYVLIRGSSDLARFEELTERARAETDPELRVRLLREALELWRGEPLGEFRREPFAQRAAVRLAELRLDALTRRIEAELELGEHERLVGELSVLVQEEPLREQTRRQFMLALYRCGRQADALAVYREGRRLLVEELGIEPGRELQELEQAILRQEPALAPQAGAAGDGRGPILCTGNTPLDLLKPLGRELVVVELAPDARTLAGAVARLERLRGEWPELRTACFTSSDLDADLVRLATEQRADLLVVEEARDALLAAATCDVALVSSNGPFEAAGAVLVPFGGGRDEWAALELGAWLARAHELPLRLLGAEAREGQRDASRMLAAASLALQRFAGVAAEPVVVAAGATGVLAEDGAVIVASLPRGELDESRRLLRAHARVPVLLVHAGLRPGGLAPDRTLTKFSWSLAG